MTTIAYRDAVLCGDTLITQGGARTGVIDKVWKTQNGLLCGYAGTLNDVAAFRKWTEGGCDGRFKQHSDGEGIVVQPDGIVFMVEGEEATLAPLMTAIIALGSGKEFAMGAMGMGATAEQAVQVACAMDVYSGGKIGVVKTNGRLQAEADAQAKAAAEAAEKGEVIPGQEDTNALLTKTLNRKSRRAAAKTPKALKPKSADTGPDKTDPNEPA